MNDDLKRPMRIYVVEGERRVADAIFNPNGYAAELNDIVLACGRRFALFLHDYSLCVDALSRDRALLISRMLDPRLGLQQLSQGTLRKAVVIMDAVTYSRALHGLLYALKSLLDIYAALVFRSILKTKSAMTFRRAKIGGVELAGGRLINWLRQSAPADCASAVTLASIFEAHSRQWITAAVALRDNLTHYDDSGVLVDLHAPLRDSPPFISESDVRGPTLKDGEPLEECVRRFHAGVLGLLSSTISLIPGVDTTRIRLDDLHYNPDHVVLRIEAHG